MVAVFRWTTNSLQHSLASCSDMQAHRLIPLTLVEAELQRWYRSV